MKKTLLAFFFAIAFCGMANAQYYYYRNSAPWDGDKAYSLNIGSNIPINVFDDVAKNATSFKYHLPLAASFRYFGEKSITENLSWGYQYEVSWLKYGAEMAKPSSTAGQSQFSSLDKWDLLLDARLTLGYYFTDNFELVGGVGIGYCLIYGYNTLKYETNDLTGVEVPNSRKTDNGIMYLTFDPNIDAYLAANYYLNDNVFLTLTLRDRISIPLSSVIGSEESGDKPLSQYGIALFGIGYKIIR